MLLLSGNRSQQKGSHFIITPVASSKILNQFKNKNLQFCTFSVLDWQASQCITDLFTPYSHVCTLHSSCQDLLKISKTNFKSRGPVLSSCSPQTPKCSAFVFASDGLCRFFQKTKKFFFYKLYWLTYSSCIYFTNRSQSLKLQKWWKKEPNHNVTNFLYIVIQFWSYMAHH